MVSDGERTITGGVAIVHEWLESRSGSEILFEEMARVLPQASLYALTAEAADSFDFGGRTVRTTLLGRRPLVAMPRSIQLPLMPLAWNAMRRPRHDLVLSSSHAFAREFGSRRDGAHLCYVHAPMRYAWNPELDPRTKAFGPAAELGRRILRRVDARSVAQVDSFAANSAEVRDRVRAHYGREARVIHPPVDVDFFAPSAQTTRGDYVLTASRWIGYKRLDLAIDAARQANVPLVLAGSGPLGDQLRAQAESSYPGGVTFVDRPSREALRALMLSARAFIFPAHEDFGIITAEAQAAGLPVVGLRRGGTAEIVAHGTTGFLADEQTPDAFASALHECLIADYSSEACTKRASAFSAPRFRDEVASWVAEYLPAH